MNIKNITKCPKCGHNACLTANFCTYCGAKIKKTCNCWVKKDNYDCGESSCPGYGLYRIEKFKSQELSEKKNYSELRGITINLPPLDLTTHDIRPTKAVSRSQKRWP